MPRRRNNTNDLPPQQERVAQLVCQGFDNEQIAVRMALAPSTIKAHLRFIYARYNFTWGDSRVRLVLARLKVPPVCYRCELPIRDAEFQSDESGTRHLNACPVVVS